MNQNLIINQLMHVFLNLSKNKQIIRYTKTLQIIKKQVFQNC